MCQGVARRAGGVTRATRCVTYPSGWPVRLGLVKATSGNPWGSLSSVYIRERRARAHAALRVLPNAHPTPSSRVPAQILPPTLPASNKGQNATACCCACARSFDASLACLSVGTFGSARLATQFGTYHLGANVRKKCKIRLLLSRRLSPFLFILGISFYTDSGRVFCRDRFNIYLYVATSARTGRSSCMRFFCQRALSFGVLSG